MLLPDRGLWCFRVAGYRVEGGVLWLRHCPARLITPFTRLMLQWWAWLDEWKQTPVSMGATFDEVDPAFWPAMEVLKREQRRIEHEEFEKVRNEGK